MPRYQFKCPTHGDYDVYLAFTDDLHTNSCPTCKNPSKRVYTPVAHRWSGLQSPTLEIDQTKRRFENNKKIYGEKKAEQMELKNKKHRSQKVIDPFD